jgi:hypothetical protein
MGKACLRALLWIAATCFLAGLAAGTAVGGAIWGKRMPVPASTSGHQAHNQADYLGLAIISTASATLRPEQGLSYSPRAISCLTLTSFADFAMTSSTIFS